MLIMPREDSAVLVVATKQRQTEREQRYLLNGYFYYRGSEEAD